MIYEVKYSIGQTVYLLTDSEQLERVVTQIIIMPGTIVYELSHSTFSSKHYDFEITTEQDELKKLK